MNAPLQHVPNLRSRSEVAGISSTPLLGSAEPDQLQKQQTMQPIGETQAESSEEEKE